MPEPTWTPAPVDKDRLQFRVGTSIVEQFASGHDFSAVFRELVQNEYDAGGSRLTVSFGRDGLRVSGTGQAIDAEGWARLSVVFGTGRVAGTQAAIHPKVNGIGSKNFGLRSLFLLGDTIYVRSAGRQNVLSVTHGTYPEPLPDESSRGAPGVALYVPFRESAVGLLPAFDESREHDALDALASGLGPTLTKLASPNGGKGLSRVEIRSERHQRELVWSQRATEVACKVRGVQVLRRSMSLSDSRGQNRAATEIEFTRALAVPERFRGKPFPRYFARNRNRLAIAVSVRLQRNRIDLKSSGSWFYPIGVTGQSTGNCVSVSAPFEMDNDRSAIAPSGVNDWNKWLLEEAASLVADLLPADWWKRFGADAYAAAHQAHVPSDPHYMNAVARLLKESAIWPTRSAGRPQQLVKACDLVVADPAAVDGVLAEQRYAPEVALQSQRFVLALREAGAKPFSVSAFVRLRCAGADGSKLASKLDPKSANFHLTDYPAPLKRLDVQLKHAAVLDAVQRRLSPGNRRDLRDTPTTLAASGELRPASELQRVPESIADACPLPASARLHPGLLKSRVLRQLTNEYRPDAWMMDVAERAGRNAVSDDERQAVYRFLQARQGQVSGRLLAVLRRSPVVRDSNGAWAAPCDLAQRGTPGADDFTPVLRFPDPEIEKESRLVRALRIRNRLRAEDLLAFGKLVEAEPSQAQAFERVLQKHRRLLTAHVRAALSALAVLRSTEGGNAAPTDLYVESPRLRECLGPDASFAASSLPDALLVQLGCRNEPRVTDIVAHLERLEGESRGLDAPDVIYRELGRALLRERLQPASFGVRRILWSDCGWVAPAEAVVGAEAARMPQGAVPRPVGVGAEAADVCVRLGAHRTLQAQHWRNLLIWAGQTFGERGPIPKDIRHLVRDAYVRLADTPGEFEPDARILLDRNGRLRPYDAARSGHFVLDDVPALAEALEHDRAPVAFADTVNPRTLRFYHAVGVGTLRERRGRVRVEVGETRRPPARVKLEEVARRATDAAFSNALAAFFASRCRRRSGVALPRASDISRRLRGLRQLTFVSELHEVYKVAGHTVRVYVRAHDDGERILVCGIRSTTEAIMVAADAMAPALPDAEGFEWADVLFRLLSCETVEEIHGFLRDRGVAWTPPRSTGQAGEVDEVDEVADAVEEALGIAAAPVAPRALPAPAPRLLPTETEERPATALPPLEAVEPLVVSTSGAEVSQARVARTGGGGGGGVGPRTEERDQEIGERGEAVVYGLERDRVHAAGMDPDLVLWTSRDNPTADHDIRSVDASGRPIWIEVKATVGYDGKFRWSRAEFDLARQVRDAYVLVRVYGAATVHPVVKHFPNPVALLLEERIRLDIAQLQAEVESAETPASSPAIEAPRQ